MRGCTWRGSKIKVNTCSHCTKKQIDACSLIQRKTFWKWRHHSHFHYGQCKVCSRVGNLLSRSTKYRESKETQRRCIQKAGSSAGGQVLQNVSDWIYTSKICRTYITFSQHLRTFWVWSGANVQKYFRYKYSFRFRKYCNTSISVLFPCISL